MNMMNEGLPTARFTYSLNFPAIPMTTLLNAVVLLLNAYGINHQVPYDDNFTGDSMNSGDPAADARFQADYVSFKMFLDGLSREYTSVNCGVVSNAIGIYMTFDCR